MLIGSANTDAGGRGVAVVDRGMLGPMSATPVKSTGRLDGLERGRLQDNDVAKASL
jgi:hypothetical protein